MNPTAKAGGLCLYLEVVCLATPAPSDFGCDDITVTQDLRPGRSSRCFAACLAWNVGCFTGLTFLVAQPHTTRYRKEPGVS